MAFANDCLDALGVCPNSIFTISVGQKTLGESVLQLIDPLTGATIDLTQFGIPTDNSEVDPKTGVEIVIKEMPYSAPYMTTWAVVKSTADAELGVVYIPIDEVISQLPGIWLGMAIIWEDGDIRKHYPFYFNVTPNLREYNPYGCITMYEVRLAVRDTAPEINFLIDTVEFKDEEIAWAIRRPIDYWNEVPPPIQTFTPINFPFRYHWMEAVIGELLRLVATWMRRNDLDYSAAGLTVADTKKWPDYLKMGQERQADWKEWVKHKKMEMNIADSFSSLGGYYTHDNY